MKVFLKELYSALWVHVKPICLIIVGATLIFIIIKFLFVKIKNKIK